MSFATMIAKELYLAKVSNSAIVLTIFCYGLILLVH